MEKIVRPWEVAQKKRDAIIGNVAIFLITMALVLLLYFN